MLPVDQIKTLIQGAIDDLYGAGIIEQPLLFEAATVIFGSSASLDSLGFVTLIAEIEDRLNDITGNDFCIVLLDIDDFNENEPHLTIGRLVDYLTKLIAT